MAKENTQTSEQTKHALSQLLDLERKKSPEVTDREIELVNKLATSNVLCDETVDVVWPTICRNPSQEQIHTLMKDGNGPYSEGSIYSGLDSFWVGVYHNLENTPEDRDLGEKIIRAAAQIMTDTNTYASCSKDYSLINFYNRISSDRYSADSFESVPDGIVKSPKMKVIMLEELNKKLKEKLAKSSILDDDISKTREFLMRVISVSKLPEGQIACTGLMDTLHGAEKTYLEQKHKLNPDMSAEQKAADIAKLNSWHKFEKNILQETSTRNISAPSHTKGE